MDKFGHATRDATDAVKGGINTVIGAGQGVLETGQHLGSEIENVRIENLTSTIFHFNNLYHKIIVMIICLNSTGK